MAKKCAKLLKEAFDGIEFSYKLDDVLGAIPNNQKFNTNQMVGYLTKQGVSPKEIKAAELDSWFPGDSPVSTNEWLEKLGKSQHKLTNVDQTFSDYSDITLGHKGINNPTYQESLTTVRKPVDNAPKESHYADHLETINEMSETKQSLLGWRRTHVDEINGKPTTVLNEFQSDWSQSERSGRGSFKETSQLLKQARELNLSPTHKIKPLDDINLGEGANLWVPLSRLPMEIEEQIIKVSPNWMLKNGNLNVKKVNINQIKEALKDNIKSYTFNINKLELYKGNQEQLLIDKIKNTSSFYQEQLNNVIADFPMSEKKFHQYQIVASIDEAIKNGTNRVAIPIDRSGELKGSQGVTKFYENLNKSILPDIRKKLDKQGLKLGMSKEAYGSADGLNKLEKMRDWLDEIVKNSNQPEIKIQKLMTHLDESYNDAERIDIWSEVIDRWDELGLNNFEGYPLQESFDEEMARGLLPQSNTLHIIEIIEKPNTKVKWDVYGVLGAIGLSELADKLQEKEGL